mmetsp:Transcript_221/g.1049  ORF Transcript_221/g.1049 Transcript_221/m.1049 type:complete len:329 (-) Transcript_221:2492-3478(-)
MEISKQDTSTPLHAGGEISAMYWGQMAKPRPTPRPTITRPRKTMANECDAAMTSMPTAYSTTAIFTHLTAPNLLYIVPPPMAPAADTKFRHPTAISSCVLVKLKSRDMGSNAPAMTPMSYPRSPANMDTVMTEEIASHSRLPPRLLGCSISMLLIISWVSSSSRTSFSEAAMESLSMYPRRMGPLARRAPSVLHVPGAHATRRQQRDARARHVEVRVRHGRQDIRPRRPRAHRRGRRGERPVQRPHTRPLRLLPGGSPPQDHVLGGRERPHLREEVRAPHRRCRGRPRAQPAGSDVPGWIHRRLTKHRNPGRGVRLEEAPAADARVGR